MLLIRGSVLSGEAPFAVRAYYCLQIVVGVVGRIAGRAVADLQIENLGGAAVDEVVRIAAAGAEPGAHARLEQRRAGVGDERGVTLKNVDEFVLLRMRVPQCGLRPRREAGEIDAEVGEPEELAERALLAALHAGDERLGIVGGLRARGALRPDRRLTRPRLHEPAGRRDRTTGPWGRSLRAGSRASSPAPGTG